MSTVTDQAVTVQAVTDQTRGAGTRVTIDTWTALDQWLAGLDGVGLAEARACLSSGTYSRALLASLRTALSAGAADRRGLDDPHRVVAGEPLGATVQTFLRERLLTAGRPRPAGHRVVPAQRTHR
ncbi:hypothetical protein [Kineococcus sp. SYSU DK003]|uniref:hypothetical protein n=1 Tax=Kineococcus sp. SYSU DK003 TaxID=3383124 RepID=UPI003D7E3614